MNGPAEACDGGKVGNFGTDFTLERGNLAVGLSPNTLSSCRETLVTIDVTGGSPANLTDHVVVTLLPAPPTYLHLPIRHWVELSPGSRLT